LTVCSYRVYKHRTKTILPHRQGEEHTVRGAYMLTTPIFGNYIHTNTHVAAQINNPNKEAPHNDVWMNG
jgi:hypothetical protein